MSSTLAKAPLCEPTTMDALSSALAVLTAMITPAVLISACGTLVLSTSVRLGRVVDRVRSLADRFEELATRTEGLELVEEARSHFDSRQLTTAPRILQEAWSFLHAFGIFVATSVAIGRWRPRGGGLRWLPVALGIIGAAFL